MTDNLGWYPPAGICYPPELPNYLKNIYELKPIIGVPSDDEVIRIHVVLQAARKASEIPGMYDSGLLMDLADHLFGAQMARYRSKYSLITFPSDATYTPPTLPAHISVKLELISGAPTDEEMTRAQDALRSYQQFNHAPSMFDAHTNMELSQHLFDLQMARYMRRAGEIQPSLEPPAIAKPENLVQSMRPSFDITEDTVTTNNLGTGGNATGVSHTSHLASVDVRELMERSNQLAERFNQLLERSNELVERYGQPSEQPNSLAERFDQVLERLTHFVERTRESDEQSKSDQLAERFNQLLERFNQLAEQSSQSANRSNELADQSNELIRKANQLAEQATKPIERTADLLKNINKVLVGIQHAIVRNHKGNTLYAVDCLVNEAGQTPKEGLGRRFSWKFELTSRTDDNRLPVRIEGAPQVSFMYNLWLGRYLRFYGIGETLRDNAASTTLKAGKEQEARETLSDYLSSCLG
ncbi:unnamed protein product [Rhizoctonia solani]|uniref:Laminin domain protein n=1 Tax=Rhizoctonia solani TaxID=456999 RepID=A0A8H2X491_9AGAM|nr:unnamed protein product [Rhizoctonia solani]